MQRTVPFQKFFVTLNGYTFVLASTLHKIMVIDSVVKQTTRDTCYAARNIKAQGYLLKIITIKFVTIGRL